MLHSFVFQRWLNFFICVPAIHFQVSRLAFSISLSALGIKLLEKFVLSAKFKFRAGSIPG